MSHLESNTVSPNDRQPGQSPMKFMLLWFGLPLIAILLSEVFGFAGTVEGWVNSVTNDRPAIHHVKQGDHPAHVDPVPAKPGPVTDDTRVVVPATGAAP